MKRLLCLLVLVPFLFVQGCSLAPTQQDVINDVACAAALAGVGISIAGAAMGAAAILGLITTQGPAVVSACSAVIASLTTQIKGQVAMQKAEYAKTHAAAIRGQVLVVPITVK